MLKSDFSTLLVSLIILLSTSSFVACNTGSVGSNQNVSEFTSVDSKEFNKLIISLDDEILLDVRTPGEVAEGIIPGAVVIDFKGDNFIEEAEKLDHNKPILVYCRSGRRSASASQILTELGFEQVTDLKGGIISWQESFPAQLEDGLAE